MSNVISSAWRFGAARVDANPHTESLYEPAKVEQRLNLLELEAEIIACTNRIVQHETEMAKLTFKRADLLQKVAEKAAELGVSEAMLRAAGQRYE
jgi:hypothetical protein